MLKYEVDKLDDVAENLRGMYAESEGKFRLKVDGLEDTGALKRAKEHESKARKEQSERARLAEERLAELESQSAAAIAEAARKGGDVAALEKSWQEKMDKATAKLAGELSARDSIVRNLTVGNTAQAIAADLAVQGSSKALLPHIERRLTMEMRDGQPVVVVLDASGKPRASTVDELKAEFQADPAFAPLIVASNASGGGGTSGKGGGGGHSLPKTIGECKTPAEKVAWLKANNKVQ